MAITIRGPRTIRVTLSNAYLANDYDITGVDVIDIQLPNDLTDAYMVRYQVYQGGDQIERYVAAGDGYQIPVGKGSRVLVNIKAIAATTPDADIAAW